MLALLFVIFQPRLQAWVRERIQDTAQANKNQSQPLVLLVVLIYFAGVYGGYFVAAQGILLVGILGIFLHGTLQQANAMKNILVLGVNVVAAASYLLFAFDRIDWTVVGLIAVSSLIGGVIGSKVGRRLSPVGPARASSSSSGLVALGFMIANLFK